VKGAKTARNRPVMRWKKSNKCITMGDATKKLGFKSFYVLQDPLKYNISRIEDIMQV
jgi:hypothetical protein